MPNHQFENLEPRRRSGTVVPYIIIALLVLVLAILLFVFFFSPETVSDLRSAAGLSTGQEQVKEQTENDTSASTEAARNGEDSAARVVGADDTETETTGSEDVLERTGPLVTDDASCDERADRIETFFNTLDTRAYIQEFKLDAPSVEYFPRLIQKLIDNPPIVSGETDDLFTILQNTAHFFRIIGKKNIIVLKGILDRERETFETVLADFYQLTKQPECLQRRFNLNIYQDSLYNYAAFFLNTMGGRLYLFRRDSMSRMVVNYYAILIIEEANRAARNAYGIDIRDAIDNLIVEIESSRIDLQLRETYLDNLYDLKVAYQ